MWKKRKRKEKILFLSPEEIFPNPWGPRRKFPPEELDRLSQSIARYGILQPLIVQKKGGDYQLICGERRLRAARLLEMDSVPCRVLALTPKSAAELALVENAFGEKLNEFEEAAVADRLLKQFRYYQTELADRLGQSPSTLWAKLRLLRFSPEERDLIEKHALSSRHTDALLHLRDPAMRLFALNYMTEHTLSPEQAQDLTLTLATHPEEFIPSLRPRTAEAIPTTVRRLVIRDVRLFVNSVDRAILSIRQAGFSVEAEKEEEDAYISYSIRVPKYTKE